MVLLPVEGPSYPRHEGEESRELGGKEQRYSLRMRQVALDHFGDSCIDYSSVSDWLPKSASEISSLSLTFLRISLVLSERKDRNCR